MNPAGLTTTTRALQLAVAALLALTLVGCGGPSRSGSDQPGVAGPSSTSTVSINASSDKDIAAALRAKDVDDPEEWAQRVGAERPYPTDDPGLNKLRQDLARYNPDPATLDRIIGTLSP